MFGGSKLSIVKMFVWTVYRYFPRTNTRPDPPHKMSFSIDSPITEGKLTRGNYDLSLIPSCLYKVLFLWNPLEIRFCVCVCVRDVCVHTNHVRNFL